jgi:ABC-2 type transport system ATP-binding protein
LNSDVKSVELSNVQLTRGTRALFQKPLEIQLVSGMLNILVGENGSGKTSLLDIIAMRVQAPNDAQVKRTGHSKSTEIAYLPQQLWDVLDIRVIELLSLSASAGSCAGLDVASGLTGIPRFSRRVLGRLSGGQRQLLLFDIVSSQKLAVFVYDEPFRHLDPNAAELVVRKLEAQVTRGDLVVLSEHSVQDRWGVGCNRIELHGICRGNL